MKRFVDGKWRDVFVDRSFTIDARDDRTLKALLGGPEALEEMRQLHSEARGFVFDPLVIPTDEEFRDDPALELERERRRFRDLGETK